MSSPVVLAVDLGASSVRVAAVDLDQEPMSAEILHRYHHGPVAATDGSLRWGWDRLMAEVVVGLEKGLASGPVASIGVDTWGVDYGLLDDAGRLLSAPYSYRDPRTSRWGEVAARLGWDDLYQRSGIVPMAINTIFQLAAHDRAELARAGQLLMLPELVVHHLTGVITGERTSAGTTGLVDLSTGTWSADLAEAIGVDPAILPPLQPAGTRCGTWSDIPVHLVGGHDTASAVLAASLNKGEAFISSGTWMLVGVEREEPELSGFSNEVGAFGGYRVLRNVMGLWMLDQCHLAPEVVEQAARLPTGGPVVDATDERFLAPPDMVAEIGQAADLVGDVAPERLARCVLDSLAAATATVVHALDATGVVMIGGGLRTPGLVDLVSHACGLPVRAGPLEAAAVGNAMAQAREVTAGST